MTNKPEDRFNISLQLLARKGGAGPLERNVPGIELVGHAVPTRTDDNRLKDAVVRATLDRLAPSANAARKPVAALTDLLDPTLVGAVSPHSGQVARSTVEKRRRD